MTLPFGQSRGRHHRRRSRRSHPGLRSCFRGLKPLILDKAVFPRIKVCAGGLTIKALKFLPPDLGPVLEDEIRRVQLSFNLGRAFTKAWHQPLLYTVERQRFDAFLMERVRQAGGEFGDGERLEKITAGPGDSSTLVTSRRLITARVVVGADGARSKVARGAGLQPVDFWHLGLQMEVPRNLMGKSASEFTRTICLDLGTMADGYAWVFPRGEVLLIGVGARCTRDRSSSGIMPACCLTWAWGSSLSPWRRTSFPTG